MRRGGWAVDPAALRTASWNGVIRASRLVRLGVPESTVYHRCRPGGPWQRLLPGIIMLGNGCPSERDRMVAALLYGGGSAVLTGLLAARRHGVRRGVGPGDDAVHVLVPHDRQLRTSGFVVVERTWRLPDPVIVGGLPLAPVVRACLDGARRQLAPGQVTELLADAVQRGLCNVPELVDELNAGSRRGSKIPREVLTGVGNGVRSAAERDAHRLWPQTGLPEPWWNARVYDERGGLLGIADGWCDEVALAWEIDSYAFHLSPVDYRRTVERAARLAASGVIVVPSLPTRLRQDPTGVVTELRSAYRAAAARPRPPVRAVRAEPRS